MAEANVYAQGVTSNEAVHQVLRYAQDAGRWAYADLKPKFRQYSGEVGSL